jgi:hypothetical protein
MSCYNPIVYTSNLSLLSILRPAGTIDSGSPRAVPYLGVGEDNVEAAGQKFLCGAAHVPVSARQSRLTTRPLFQTQGKGGMLQLQYFSVLRIRIQDPVPF